MLKVRLNCPVCGEPIGARSLDGHLENVHKLTGTVTLRLNPTNPYLHEPKDEGPEKEPEMGLASEAEAESDALGSQ